MCVNSLKPIRHLVQSVPGSSLNNSPGSFINKGFPLKSFSSALCFKTLKKYAFHCSLHINVYILYTFDNNL